MRSDRAAAGLSGAALFVALAFAPEKVTMREIVFLVLAAVWLVVAFAPVLPVLNGIPKIGAPRVRVALGFVRPGGASGNADSLQITHVGGLAAEPRVLRVAFINKGPKTVRDAMVNVLVDAALDLQASTRTGEPEDRGRDMGPTDVDGRPMRFWAEPDVALIVGHRQFHYRLGVPHVEALGDKVLIRVQYGADALYGGERIHDEWVPVVNLKEDPNV
jgi:hypothetical protein